MKKLDETTTLEGVGSTGGLGAELERELRAAINPAYEDTRGTDSYERKRLLGEIDRLREALEHIAAYPKLRKDELGYAGTRKIAWEALHVPNVELTGGASAPSSDRRERG